MKHLLLLLGISSLLSACVSTSGGIQHDNTAKMEYRTEVTIGKCQSDTAESAVLTALFSSLIATGVDRIAGMLKKAGEKETLQTLASRNVELSNAGLGPCLIVVRGQFHRLKKAADKFDFAKDYSIKPDTEFTFNNTTAITSLRNMGLDLASTPDFYFEGRFKKASDASSNFLVLSPLYAYLGRPIPGAILGKKNQRSVMLSFAINKGGSQSNFSKGAGASVVLGKLKVGESKIYPDKGGSNEVTIKDVSGKTSLIVRNSIESNWFSLPLSKDLAAMNLQVLVSETRDESKFLKFVSDVLGGATDEIKSELQNTLISSKKGALDATANSAYDAAYVAASKALSACAALTTANPETALTAKNSVLALVKAKASASATLPSDTIGADDAKTISIGVTDVPAASCKLLVAKL